MSAPRLAGALGERLAPRDVVVHLSVVAALLLAYLSPIPYKSFLYRPGVSDLGAAYLSLLGHADVAHLLGNVFGFLALAFASLLLLSGVSHKRFYYVCFALTVIVVPPLAALQWEFALALTEPGAVGIVAGSGFSIVTAAFAGVLAVAIGVHQREALSMGLPPVVASAWLLSIAAFVASITGGGPVSLVAGSGAVALAYLAVTGARIRRKLGEPAEAIDLSLHVIGLCTFVGASVDLFALRPDGVAVSAHAVGLAYGIVVAWLVLGARSLASRGRSPE